MENNPPDFKSNKTNQPAFLCLCNLAIHFGDKAHLSAIKLRLLHKTRLDFQREKPESCHQEHR